jgi:hypothetical protein
MVPKRDARQIPQIVRTQERRLRSVARNWFADGGEHRRHAGDRAKIRPNQIRENLRSAQRWNDVPRGTMDEVSSYVRLNLQSH